MFANDTEARASLPVAGAALKLAAKGIFAPGTVSSLMLEATVFRDPFTAKAPIIAITPNMATNANTTTGLNLGILLSSLDYKCINVGNYDLPQHKLPGGNIHSALKSGLKYVKGCPSSMQCAYIITNRSGMEVVMGLIFFQFRY
jgi:hypothetical protein